LYLRLERHVEREETCMRGTPPAPEPEELAGWLLASEGGGHDDLEELTMGAIHTYERLRAHLSIFLGLQGFDALWVRALHLVRRTFPWDDTGVMSAVSLSPHCLDTVVRGRNAAAAHDIFLAVFTQFLALLFTFIGADLGCRLLHQHWPALPTPTANEQGEEAQQ
jgi:hypothetical protein